MKDINHDYWKEYESQDADAVNPDLRVAMNQLYGTDLIDFGEVKGSKAIYKNESDECTHFAPDGWSTYTSLTGNYIEQMPFRKEAREENITLVNKLWKLASTIAGELFFPCRRIDGNTINQNRGTFGKISDRVDLTLRDIKRYYDKEVSDYPLKSTLLRYAFFFDQFASFKEYIDHCLLKDFCDENYNVKLWQDKYGLPQTKEELVDFWKWSIEVLERRLKRIEKFANEHGLFDE